nr:MAG TPA: hypothetical protein [Caudoviricetes sp.]
MIFRVPGQSLVECPVGECPRRKMAALRKQLDLYF